MIRFARLFCLQALIFPVAAWTAEGAPIQEGTTSPPSPLPQQAQAAVAQAGVSKPEGKPPQDGALFNLLKEVEALKAEVSRLRGQTEMQAHQLETLSKRQSDLYVDLDKRVEDLSKQAKTAAPVTPPPAPVVAAANPAATPAASSAAGSPPKEDPLAESRSYETALNQFKAGDYDKAIAGFTGFLKDYPDSTLAANAQYWTGYAYYARKDYKNALAQQMKLVSAYPQSPKVPDALLNIASNQVELKDLASAKKNLEEIVAKYPGTNAAAIAAKRLNLLK